MGGGVCAAGILKRASYRNSLWVSCGEGGRAIDKTFSSFPRWSGGLATGLLFSRDTSDRARPIYMFRNFRRNFRRRCLIRRSSDFLPPFPSIILGIINA